MSPSSIIRRLVDRVRVAYVAQRPRECTVADEARKGVDLVAEGEGGVECPHLSSSSFQWQPVRPLPASQQGRAELSCRKPYPPSYMCGETQLELACDSDEKSPLRRGMEGELGGINRPAYATFSVHHALHLLLSPGPSGAQAWDLGAAEHGQHGRSAGAAGASGGRPGKRAGAAFGGGEEAGATGGRRWPAREERG
uniref:Uncharacterized protein n=1 Tax=Oryza glumipatula TaxID=40148 RepID=A0A0E0B5U7_9ORYZ